MFSVRNGLARNPDRQSGLETGQAKLTKLTVARASD